MFSVQSPVKEIANGCPLPATIQVATSRNRHSVHVVAFQLTWTKMTQRPTLTHCVLPPIWLSRHGMGMNKPALLRNLVVPRLLASACAVAACAAAPAAHADTATESAATESTAGKSASGEAAADAEEPAATASASDTPPAEPEIPAVAPLRPIPKERLFLTNLSIFRWNPIGLENQLRLGYQRKLYDANDNKALRDNFWHVGTFVRLNPASARAAAVVEVQPLSLLNLRFTAEYLHYYGNFTFLQSRPDAGATAADNPSLSDSGMKDNKEGAFGNYSGGGVHATFEPLLQVKVGNIAIRSRGFFGYFDMDLKRGDRVWYEPTLDVPVPAKGMVIANDLDVLYVTDFGLNIGLRHTSVFPQYSKAQNPDGTDNSHQRLGLLAAYTWRDDGYTRFNKPTALLMTSWYLSHRNRTGQDVSNAMPYFVLGFAFTSDLLDVKAK